MLWSIGRACELILFWEMHYWWCYWTSGALDLKICEAAHHIRLPIILMPFHCIKQRSVSQNKNVACDCHACLKFSFYLEVFFIDRWLSSRERILVLRVNWVYRDSSSTDKTRERKNCHAGMILLLLWGFFLTYVAKTTINIPTHRLIAHSLPTWNRDEWHPYIFTMRLLSANSSALFLKKENMVWTKPEQVYYDGRGAKPN